LRSLGAKKVYRINKPPFAIHSHSTMRMGLSADDSVLDASAESRSVKRLFIADNSALANGIGGPNPTLTTQALATSHRRNHLHAVFRWISLGATGISGVLGRSDRHACRHRAQTGLAAGGVGRMSFAPARAETPVEFVKS
jgi:hypothetical protein